MQLMKCGPTLESLYIDASRALCPAFGSSRISGWLKTLVHFYLFILFSILVDLAQHSFLFLVFLQFSGFGNCTEVQL